MIFFRQLLLFCRFLHTVKKNTRYRYRKTLEFIEHTVCHSARIFIFKLLYKGTYFWCFWPAICDFTEGKEITKKWIYLSHWLRPLLHTVYNSQVKREGWKNAVKKKCFPSFVVMQRHLVDIFAHCNRVMSQNQSRPHSVLFSYSCVRCVCVCGCMINVTVQTKCLILYREF